MKNTVGLCSVCQGVTGVHPHTSNRSICNDCDKPVATIEYFNQDGSTKITLSDKSEPLWFEGDHYEHELNDSLKQLTEQGYQFDDQTGMEVVPGIF